VNQDIDGGGEARAGPWILRFDDFISASEADALMAHARRYGFERSKEQTGGDALNALEVAAADAKAKARDDGSGDDASSQQLDLSSTTGRPSLNTAARTSTSSICDEQCENDALISDLRSRIAALTSGDPDFSEPLGIVKYEEGQFYKPHHDYADGDSARPASGRLLTLLIYLSEPDEVAGGGADGDVNAAHNGATFFPMLNVSVPPTQYSALLWSNVAVMPSVAHGPEVKDIRVIHGSASVERGEKYVANAWIHAGDVRIANKWGCAGAAMVLPT